MTPEAVMLLLSFLLATGLVLGFAEVAMRERTIRRSRLDTSRFPLFAARDRLVSLVADRQLSERDAIWDDAYAGVNDLLDEANEQGLIGLTNRHLEFSIRLARDEGFRRRFQGYVMRQRAAIERTPALGEAIAAADAAVLEMCRRRTSGLLLAMYVRFLKSASVSLALCSHGLLGMRAFLAVWRSGSATPSSLRAFARHEAAA